MYNIFSQEYLEIGKKIDGFFLSETEIEDPNLKKDLKVFKEMIVNSVDEIHKKILLVNIQEKEKRKKEKEEREKIENEQKYVAKVKSKKGGFWD